MTWDLFCSVIDNFGDIGVTWRLARQLAAEHGQSVRLWVDDLATFRRIRPEIDPELDTQHLAGVEVRRWTSPLPDVEPGEVVIEALACELPETFVLRMAAKTPRPLWLNLEYLTAEAWAQGVHGLPSPHPRLPLTKYFFMPGFTPHSGGLTREAWLTAARDVFQADAHAQARFWAGLAIPPHDTDELRVSLFSYENRALPSLLHAWSHGPREVRALVPQGKALPQIATWFGSDLPAPGEALQRGRLTLHVLPMLDQDGYDRLLWACDLNFVRGEDSLLRAQYAARPMAWQAYPQAERAHFAKLDAFLSLYRQDMPAGPAQTTHAFWHGWNEEADVGAHWHDWLAHLDEHAAHARRWDARLAEQPDLASKLLIFCEKLMEKS
ncbi:MAG: elongation factor P maturation arginine rhamnosyltransferase EarP [Pseudomonadota bacterium]